MASRRKLIAKLRAAEFYSVGGTKHEKFKHKDGRYTNVPRHSEIKESLYKLILKQANIDD